MALSLSVCLSPTSRSSIKTSGRNQLVFGTDASFGDGRLLVCSRLRKFGYDKSQFTYDFSLQLCPKVDGLAKISPRHVDRRNVLSTWLDKDGLSGR